MNIEHYKFIFDRDLGKLSEELRQYQQEESIWQVLPGTINSGGHLIQHLIVNLNTYIGNPFGNIQYVRDREADFNARRFSREELLEELQRLRETISFSLSRIRKEALDAPYPREILSIHANQTIELVIVHLLAHLSYHLGQINYHRRYFSVQ